MAGFLRMAHCWVCCVPFVGGDGGEEGGSRLRTEAEPESGLDELCAESLSSTSCDELIRRSSPMEAPLILRCLSSVE
jgi:hypothetical protein